MSMYKIQKPAGLLPIRKPRPINHQVGVPHFTVRQKAKYGSQNTSGGYDGPGWDDSGVERSVRTKIGNIVIDMPVIADDVDFKTTATAATTQAASGNWFAAAATVVAAFISKWFGGKSKADQDREEQTRSWLNDVWPQLKVRLQDLIDTTKASSPAAPVYAAIAQQKKYAPALDARMSQLWGLYVHFLNEAIAISKDVSKSKTDAVTRINNLMGTGEKNQGDGAIQMFGRIYNEVMTYGSDKQLTPEIPAVPGGPAVTTNPQTTAVLKIGSRGPEVLLLQGMLKKAGYDPKGLDGIFGVNTEAAVKAFQKNIGMAQTGEVGNDILSVLSAVIAKAGETVTIPGAGTVTITQDGNITVAPTGGTATQPGTVTGGGGGAGGEAYGAEPFYKKPIFWGVTIGTLLLAGGGIMLAQRKK